MNYEEADGWVEEAVEIDDEERARRRAAALKDKVRAIVGDLTQEVESRISKRETIEDRWLDDLSQFHGKYSEKMVGNLKEAKRSSLYINLTRQKTNAMEARLSDMLFPTDDRNFGISQTPVPELTQEAERASQAAIDAKMKLAQDPENQALIQAVTEADLIADRIQAVVDEAAMRAKLMEDEIEDIFKHSRYEAACRDAIRDACQIGTGIIKGPVLGGPNKRRWMANQATGEYELVSVPDESPRYWWVDPWNFFPSMDARTIADTEGTFERHLKTKKDLKRMAKEFGFSAFEGAFRRLLESGSREKLPTYIADLSTLTDTSRDLSDEVYHLWEYHGPLDPEHIKDIVESIGDESMMEDVLGQEADPLIDISVTIWFCQGEMIRFGIHPLDSNETLYSVFNLERDSTSIFGYGIPYIMRDSQAAVSAAWRTMMDNAGLSSGPQIIVDRDVIEPADGVWILEPRKIWWRKGGAENANKEPFLVREIASNQNELAAIIQMAKQNIDDETAMPQIAQGEQGSHVTKTAHGMSLLMNSANIVFRRIVKNWDDDMSVPNVRRAYDWLMQFSPKQEIKGDYEIVAKGSSVLLVREMQSANLMTVIQMFIGHPILDAFLKDRGLPLVRRLLQTMMIPVEDTLKSDADLKMEEAQASQSPPPPPPEIIRAEADMNMKEIDRETRLEIARMEHESRIQIANINRETELIKLAESNNMKLEDIRAKLYQSQQAIDSSERKFAAEAAVTKSRGASGGGHF